MYKITYTGDGTTTDFLFAFPFFSVADIQVSVDDRALAPDSFVVTPNDDLTGGMVHTITPPVADSTIDIFRQISPSSRVIDYQPTEKIDPEHLNTDFNFLVAALNDVQTLNIDFAQWQNRYDNVVSFLNYTHQVIQDKIGGGAVLGLYNNLMSVLHGALPLLINDYGSVTEPSSEECDDDYGVL